VNRKKYSEYLNSLDWKNKRQKALDHYGNSCVLCDSNAVDVHHRTYDRIYNEDVSDLIVLCRDCHATHHKKLSKQVPKGFKESTQRFFLNIPLEIAQLPLQNSAKLVYGVLKMHCLSNNVCRLRWDTLQKETGLSRASIARGLKKLRKEKLVGNLRTGRSSFYVVYPPAL